MTIPILSWRVLSRRRGAWRACVLAMPSPIPIWRSCSTRCGRCMRSTLLLSGSPSGCGRVSGHHCRSIRDNEGIELAAVCDLVEEKAARYGKEFGVPYFLNYHEMLRAVPEIDIVAVITPSGMHFEHATEIMRSYRK